MALPRAKSDAMCVVYAFMRRADDLADDESFPLEQRRTSMAAWLSAWHAKQPMEPGDAPVFRALADVQQRYGVSDSLLDELVSGTAMDLEPEPPAGVVRVTAANGKQFDAYRSMVALEGYCYLVASVVGLTTIRIFGYTDPAAEPLAAELGKAFQLTNILRDVREDAERGRIYLPLDVLADHGSSLEEVLAASAGASLPPALRRAMQAVAQDAQRRYGALDALLPLLSPESRPAMRVLAGIYRALLGEIQAANFDVFARRVRVSTPRKLLLLGRGLLSGTLARASGRGDRSL